MFFDILYDNADENGSAYFDVTSADIAIIPEGGTLIEPSSTYVLSENGMELAYITNSDYPGLISIDALSVFESGDDYIFTMEYSGGELAEIASDSGLLPKTSFFDPPDGDILMVSWLDEIDRISWGDHVVQYRVDGAKLTQIAGGDQSITIMFFDTLHNTHEESGYAVLNMTIPDIEAIPLFNCDINGDGTIDLSDLVLVAQSYGTENIHMDTNADGIVDIFDLVKIAKKI